MTGWQGHFWWRDPPRDSLRLFLFRWIPICQQPWALAPKLNRQRGRKKWEFLRFIKNTSNFRTQFFPRFCPVSLSLSPPRIERRKWVLWSEWHSQRMCSVTSPWLPLAPGHPNSPACRWEVIRGKGLKEKQETQEPGSSYSEKGGTREIVRAIENSNAAKRAFSDN